MRVRIFLTLLKAISWVTDIGCFGIFVDSKIDSNSNLGMKVAQLAVFNNATKGNALARLMELQAITRETRKFHDHLNKEYVERKKFYDGVVGYFTNDNGTIEEKNKSPWG